MLRPRGCREVGAQTLLMQVCNAHGKLQRERLHEAAVAPSVRGLGLDRGPRLHDLAHVAAQAVVHRVGGRFLRGDVVEHSGAGAPMTHVHPHSGNLLDQ